MAEFINKFYFSVVQNIKSLIYFYSDQDFLSKIAVTSGCYHLHKATCKRGLISQLCNLFHEKIGLINATTFFGQIKIGIDTMA
jgi:hypothetical protein